MAEKHWQETETVQIIEKQLFTKKSREVISVICPKLQIENQIIQKANTLTQERDFFLTTLVKEMDQASTVTWAEQHWQDRGSDLGRVIRFVDRMIIERRATEIRMLCMDEETTDRVAIRCWKLALVNSVREIQRELESGVLKPSRQSGVLVQGPYLSTLLASLAPEATVGRLQPVMEPATLSGLALT
jgi:hypothetical protein